VGIGIFGLIIKSTNNIKATHALQVIVWDSTATPDYNSDLELAVGLVPDLKLSLKGMFLMGD